jgi:predicted Zn-dependent protease
LGVGVAVATSGQSQKHNKLGIVSYGIGTEVGVCSLVENETEADKIGLTLMAIAGYNPDEAIAFGQEWQQIQMVNRHLNS